MESVPPWTPAAQALQSGIYEHYKGGRYRVLGMARHSETLEELVVYEHLDDQSQWVRPLTMFLETVKTPNGSRPRFRLTTW